MIRTLKLFGKETAQPTTNHTKEKHKGIRYYVNAKVTTRRKQNHNGSDQL